VRGTQPLLQPVTIHCRCAAYVGGFLSESSGTTVIVLVAIDARRTAIFGWRTNYQRVARNGHRGTKEIVGISHLRDAILPPGVAPAHTLKSKPLIYF
jgi:hypothetical protein